MELAGRVALVTGAGVRLGRAMALALGRAGARVALHYNRSGDGAAEAAKAVRDAGGDAVLFQADLTQPEKPAELVRAVHAHFGALHILVNSAAIMERTPLEEVRPAEWDRMFALNLRAPFFCAVESAKAMRGDAGDVVASGERGVIINIADLAGLESWGGYIPHGITKAGVIHMTRSLARVLAPDIRVNAIAPGTVLLPEDFDQAASGHLERTTPLRRHGAPEDVVGGLLYLIGATFVTGEILIIDGGRHIR